MAPLKFFAILMLGFCALPVYSANDVTTSLRESCKGDSTIALQIGTPVVVVVSELPPTKMLPSDSGYSKPLVIHPGKRGVVVGLDDAREDVVIVQWEEQYWQEWTDPPVEDIIDSSRSFMSQIGKWVKWKSFTATIHSHNLIRPISYIRDHPEQESCRADGSYHKKASSISYAGGDGSSIENAILIVGAKGEFDGVDAEYAWLKTNLKIDRPLSQGIMSSSGKMFDHFRIKLLDGTERDIYFDITSFYGKM